MVHYSMLYCIITYLIDYTVLCRGYRIITYYAVLYRGYRITGCGAEGLKNSIYTGRWLSRADSAYMAPWHRTRYFNSLRQQERIQRKAITAMIKKSGTAGSSAGSKGGGGGGGGGGEGMIGDASDNMKVIQHDNREESHATIDNSLQIDQEMIPAPTKSNMMEQKDVGTREGYAESKEGVEKEENQTGRGGEGTGEGGGGGTGGAGDVDTEDEEDVTDYQWKDEDDDEEDDNYDTVLPLMEDLEDDVSLPRLFGGHCSVNMFLEDNHLTPSTPASTVKHPQSLSKPRSGSIGNEPKKRKRAPSGTGKAKAVPKTVPAPKGRGGGGGVGAGKIVLHAASAAPDAGQRAEAGDLSGLLVNGLFMSSVLIVDAYLVAKDAAIEKVRTVLYCTVLYCIVLYCTVLYCTVLYCTVLYCTVLYCTVLYCTVLYSCTIMCTVLYCTVLYCTVLYCTVLYLLYSAQLILTLSIIFQSNFLLLTVNSAFFFLLFLFCSTLILSYLIFYYYNFSHL